MRAVSFLLTVMGVLVNLVQTYNRPNHFGNPCVLCKCFVMYTDRDKPLSSVPYGVAKDGYDSTEDQCLSTCLKDNKCKGVVYGLVGGRNVFTCELYADAALDELIYVPHVNIYLPKRRSECHVYYQHLRSLELTDRQKETMKRKKIYLTLSQQQNPFNFG